MHTTKWRSFVDADPPKYGKLYKSTGKTTLGRDLSYAEVDANNSVLRQGLPIKIDSVGIFIEAVRLNYDDPALDTGDLFRPRSVSERKEKASQACGMAVWVGDSSERRGLKDAAEREFAQQGYLDGHKFMTVTGACVWVSDYDLQHFEEVQK